MITHECEACGESEDITKEVHSNSKYIHYELARKLCETCEGVYEGLKSDMEEGHSSNRKNLRENRVIEVRRKRGFEPFDQKFKFDLKDERLESPNNRPTIEHAVSLRELADEWLDLVDRSRCFNQDIQALHSFMLSVAARVEGTDE